MHKTPASQAQWKQVNIREGGEGGLTDLSSGYKVILPLNIFKTNFPSLLIRSIMTIDVQDDLSGFFRMSIFV